MVKSRNGVIAALDIGTSKIVCLIARIDADKEIEVIGIGHQLSQGYRSGVITDIKRLEHSVLAAVEAAERMAATTIDKVVLNIAGAKVLSRIVTGTLPIAGNQVTEKDITRIVTQSVEAYQPEGAEIIHAIPIDYSIDDVHGIQDPKGMCGNQLTSYLHMITAPSMNVMNMAHCLAGCQLDVDDCIVSAYASGLACLTPDEMMLGTVVVDMGGGSTSIAFFKGGHLIHTDIIPIGGQHVTSDIAQGISTTLASAERMKTLYGNAVTTEVDEEEMIDVMMMGEDAEEPLELQHVSRAFLGNIIRPRIEEIFEIVRDRLEMAGSDVAFAKRMVLTGGACQLMGLKELATHMLGRHVRIGAPRPLDGLAESTKGPAFATVIGQLHYAAHRASVGRFDVMEHEEHHRPGMLRRMVAWVQENF